MIEKTVGAIAHLAPLELDEIKRAPKEQQSKVFVIGFVDFMAQEVVLMKINNQEIDVPFEFFETSGNGSKPDFDDISIIDFGYTIAFGKKYEASSHAILYAFEPGYKLACDANKMAN